MRVPRFTPHALDLEQARLHRAITGGPRGAGPQYFALTDVDGALRGPFNAMLLAPPVGEALQALGAALRYRSSLGDRVRELAILVVAQHHGSAFERDAHEAVGAAAGLDPAVLAAIRAGAVPDLDDPAERAGVEVARALMAGDLDDDAWAAAREVLSARAVFELTVLVGYYAALALQLRVFRAEEAG